jgi:ATP-dependent Lon protease
MTEKEPNTSDQPEGTSDSEVAGFLPVLPIKNDVLFPRQLLPLTVGRPRSLAAVEAALATEDKTIVVVPQLDPNVEEPGVADLWTLGTIAVIKKMERTPIALFILVHGVSRAELESMDADGPFIRVQARPLPDPEDTGTEVEALRDEVLELAHRILEIVEPNAHGALDRMFEEVTDPLQQAYALAPFAGLDVEKERALFSAKTRTEALKLMHNWMSYQLQVVELRHKIANQAASELTRKQRQVLLRQQLREIQKELGEEGPEDAEAAEIRRRVEETELPASVQGELDKELARLERMPSHAAEYQVTRAHIELILELPWTKITDDILDLGRAREVLDEDHYDLEDLKDRILEHLAVMKLNPRAKAPILCFVGPPGVGKTSVGQSIARALGRKFERMSLGGLHDEAELRGHRRTYVGAMPGRLIQAIRRAGVSNPVLMMDEVDKLGRDFRGDPAAALMEVLDPAQNVEFRDNYLDLPFDLSRVFFITTANTLDAIPRPLLDRMEVHRLSGYSDDQKLEIARRYLIPRQLEQGGIDAEKLSFTEEAIRSMMRRYTREAGVRELERTIARVVRKVAVSFAGGHTEAVRVDEGVLTDLLGPERFFEESARRELPPGVAAGLAWTEAGGEVLYVEAVVLPDDKEILLTGHLGVVMQESARTARSLVRANSERLGLDPKATAAGVHIHIPAGAIPKDGPSAGVTMVTALASVYSGRTARSDTAMTGEITLSGLILPVGGVKEKVLAAHRAGMRRVVLPKENEKDLRDLPDTVKNEVEFVFVKRIEELLKSTLTNSDPDGPAAGTSR